MAFFLLTWSHDIRQVRVIEIRVMMHLALPQSRVEQTLGCPLPVPILPLHLVILLVAHLVASGAVVDVLVVFLQLEFVAVERVHPVPPHMVDVAVVRTVLLGREILIRGDGGVGGDG